MFKQAESKNLVQRTLRPQVSGEVHSNCKKKEEAHHHHHHHHHISVDSLLSLSWLCCHNSWWRHASSPLLSLSPCQIVRLAKWEKTEDLSQSNSDPFSSLRVLARTRITRTRTRRIRAIQEQQEERTNHVTTVDFLRIAPFKITKECNLGPYAYCGHPRMVIRKIKTQWRQTDLTSNASASETRIGCLCQHERTRCVRVADIRVVK